MKVKENSRNMLKKYAEVGENYRKARLALGLKQEQAAEYLDLAPSYVSDLENRESCGKC